MNSGSGVLWLIDVRWLISWLISWSVDFIGLQMGYIAINNDVKWLIRWLFAG